MNDTRFADLLERVMGLSAATIGPGAIERAVETRRRETACRDTDAYWALLQASSAEVQQLIEAVVVPETWFFRNPQAFRAMEGDVLGPRLRADPQACARLLSLPCSTGEEAYTMAMALMESGIAPHRFNIEAVDISQHAIDMARAGVYGRNSFRGHELGFRDRYFDAAPHGWALREEVRAPVRFSQGNIFASGFMAQAGSFDVIFCRNMLIYFDIPRQKQAIAVLRRLLAPDGTLFVGHSEAGLMREEGFVSAGMAMSFAFRRAPEAAPVAPTIAVPARAAIRPVVPKRAAPARVMERDRPVRQAIVRPAAAKVPDLATLRRMADDGRVEEAERGAQAHIRDNGASPDALLLLGLISDAGGQGKAAAHYYRKVLYLDPGNVEALGHLALLLRREGDHAGARLLDERMRRRDERTS
ncbi:chemotaxis protein methyltransferase WspC [Novosphingobium sp. SG751A]|uniref:CheR family methyltransferase n=1 Tax=Novosphingobium sp. SG751A TaxID=2587000 RepID=UPI001554AF5E|nr:protein-glutamate O-methyltransferase CheR [Novosphingobium sp. SG751A]NOW45751.1 chemotaxis protein methyltransferase WspC [Novosphingobium sp. SG751A]